jgi:putative ABC transport system permease protein
MNIYQISFKNLYRNPLTTGLNVMLVAFGIGILCILLLASKQIESKLEQNAKDIDLVVGAKGSPLQLILSSIYHIDFPTGNITVEEAAPIMKNPMVKRAVPLALGDSYEGFRIAGTDSSFIQLYQLKIGKGRYWKNDLEVNIGSTVAKVTGLKPGDRFYGAHGLDGNGDVHKQHMYQVVGILKPQGNVTDDLVLTNIGSVYKMHEPEEEEEHGSAEHHEEKEINNKEITAILIQYRSPMSVVLFPRMVNKNTNMQAASPAMESARLFSLIGVGLDTLKYFAILIMAISGLSIFISLYNSMKEKKYDLALMRCLGASKGKLFFHVVLEALAATLLGSFLGVLIGHLAVHIIGVYQESAQARLTGSYFIAEELYLIIAGLVIGLIASIIPALQVYKVDIAKTLSKS